MTRPRRTRQQNLVLGLRVVAILVIGLVVGVILDRVMGSRPIGLLIFSLIAAQLALLLVYRAIVPTFPIAAEAADVKRNETREEV